MDWIYFFDIVGTFVFAVSGVLTAIDNEFDLFGASTIGFVTALGGGSIRDILIGATPVGWMSDSNYLITILLAVVVSYLFRRHVLKVEKSLFLIDSIGIGLFTILGLQKTLSIGLSMPIALIMGIITATFGGVIRDVLSGEVPLIFRKEIYATACLLGGIVYIILTKFEGSHNFIMMLSMLIVVLIRYMSVRYNWSVRIPTK